jgi:hypothetical protein
MLHKLGACVAYHCIPDVKEFQYFELLDFVLCIFIAAGGISGVGFAWILLRDACLMVALGLLPGDLFACCTDFMN